jgi:hypothetical protein
MVPAPKALIVVLEMYHDQGTTSNSVEKGIMGGTRIIEVCPKLILKKKLV